MQKSLIHIIEWDKRINKLLYLGTLTSNMKVYDIHQKKIIQELTFNKSYPIITNIYSSASNGKLIVLMTNKLSHAAKPLEFKNSQMAVCNINDSSLNVMVENIIDLEVFFSQCSTIYLDKFFLMGILI
jgi:hypothetical protein